MENVYSECKHFSRTMSDNVAFMTIQVFEIDNDLFHVNEAIETKQILWFSRER